MNDFINDFKMNFDKNKNSPIALYGIGEKTKNIVEELSYFNFVGLMDKDTIGQTIYGLRVLNDREAISAVKIIIIVANMSAVDIIYKRISYLKKEYGIDIIYVNGTRPVDIELKEDVYFSKSLNLLKEKIKSNDIISFDLYDTLIMRKTLNPDDIFEIVDLKLKSIFHFFIDFKKKRIEAEKYCYHYMDEYYSIYDIYSILKKDLNITDNFADIILNLEFQTELECSLPRKEIVESYEFAIQNNKSVYIITDMYLTYELIEKVLKKNHIYGYKDLLISCERKMSKYNGTIFELFNSFHVGKKSLHIGDNQYSDIKMAQAHNIEAFYIRNSYDSLKNSTIYEIDMLKKNIFDNILVGNMISNLYNNPFAFNDTKSLVCIESMYDLGKIVFSPLVLKFVFFLIRRSMGEKVDKLLFFARDGYIIKIIYDEIVDFYKLKAPESIYFYTSRRSSSMASIQNYEDIKFIIKNLCKIKKSKIADILNAAFDVFADDNDEIGNMYYYEISEERFMDYVINKYGEKILSIAGDERRAYLKYISNCNITASDNLGCVNFVGRGMTQYFISKLLEKNLYGYYFGTESDMKLIFKDLSKIHGLYGELLSPYTSHIELVSKYIFGEAVFTSPEGQFIKFDKNNNMIFQKRKSDYKYIGECHKGIIDFTKEILSLNLNMECFNFSNEIIDKIYGYISSDCVYLNDSVKRNIVLEDYYNKNMEVSSCM